MSDETFYLELSEGSAHKFYEVVLEGARMTVRYGRIGDAGQSKVSTLASPEKALADARKKVDEKLRKGYGHAVRGERRKRSVTRRGAALVAEPSAAPARPGVQRTPISPAPVLWRFDSGAAAYGIFVDAERCWVGNEAGKIFALDHAGNVTAKFRVPDGVKCIVSDGAWLYAGCDDGNVYDLGGKAPRVAYSIADEVDIYWLDISDAVLAVSDASGNVTTFNHEDETQWSKRSRGTRGWMVRCDEIGIYHGHTAGVTMYDWEDGREIWHNAAPYGVLFGWQEESTVYAGTAGAKVYAISKRGEPGPIYECDGTIFACAAAEDGKYVFASDASGSIYCFAGSGERLWKLATGCGSPFSMQYFDAKLFVVTTTGALACIDASEPAIDGARRGEIPDAVAIAAPEVEPAAPAPIETTRERGSGVVVECFREGGALRVRVVSDGFQRDWRCQFPKALREEGARYVVDEVRESARGGFYRALGDIRKLV